MLRVIVLSLNTLLSWIMKFMLLGLLIFEIYTGLGFMIIIGTLIALVCSFLPMMINHSYQVNLPWVIDLWVTLALLLHIIGVTFNFYHDMPYEIWWDNMTHFLGIALIGTLAFFVVFTLNYVRKVKMSIPMIGFFTFVFSLAIGALWEIAEYFSDLYLGTRAIRGIEDTIHDLVFDTIGGALAAIVGMLYVRHKKRGKLSIALRPIMKILTGRESRR